MKVTDAWSKLDKALTGLEKAGEGRVARMNHRKKVLAALRVLRGAVDEEYPVVAKQSRRRKTPISVREWERRLSRRGWVEIGAIKERLALRCKVPHRRLRPNKIWVPKWFAMAMKEEKTEAQLKRIVKSRTEQRALNTLYVATQQGKED